MQKQTIGAIIVLVIILLTGLTLSARRAEAPLSDDVKVSETKNDETDPLDDLIHLFDPIEDASIYSPLAIYGEARGSWYFEASFPVRLYDSEGRLLGEGMATAEDDPGIDDESSDMAEDFRSFSANIEFDQPTTETGTIVLMKDNPSGDPANDMSLIVPVRFETEE